MIKLLKNNLTKTYHFLVWIILFFLYVLFLQNFISLQEAILHTSFYLTYIAMVFYLHTYYLAPRFLNKKKLIYYVAILIVMLVISNFVNDIYIENFSIKLGNIKSEHSPHGHNKYIISGTISTIFISYLAWFVIKYRNQEQQRKELIEQKSSAELAMLKSQINPHFLFNTLNNIYALSLEKAEPVVSEMILSLSEINRYMLYETDPDFVPLSKEIFYINCYIELEKLRCENKTNIHISLDEPPLSTIISPLLLIPFIENAFKHSRIVDEAEAWIKISIKVENNTLIFNCENSIPQLPFKKDGTKGIGLENVKKRLSMIYENKHNLVIDKQGNKFVVKLKLQMQ